MPGVPTTVRIRWWVTRVTQNGYGDPTKSGPIWMSTGGPTAPHFANEPNGGASFGGDSTAGDGTGINQASGGDGYIGTIDLCSDVATRLNIYMTNASTFSMMYTDGQVPAIVTVRDPSNNPIPGAHITGVPVPAASGGVGTTLLIGALDLSLDSGPICLLPPPVTEPPAVVEPSFPVIRGTSWVGVGSSTSSTSEPDEDIADHIADTIDSHDARAISYVPTAPVVAVNVQDALDAAFARGLTVEEVDGSPTDAAVKKMIFPEGSIAIADHVVTHTPVGGGGSALTVEEVDGSPTDAAITKLVFPAGTLAIAGHVATFTPASTGGGLVPVMVQATNLVTTDGSDAWVVSTLPDGTPVMG